MISSEPPSKRRWRFVRRKSRCHSTPDSVTRIRGTTGCLDLKEGIARRAEAEAPELQLTIDSIPAMVVTYRPDGTPDFVNQTWSDYTGLTLEETTGQGRIAHFHHFHPDDAEAAAQELMSLSPAGACHTLEARLRRFDGEYRWHTIRRAPRRDAKGDIVKWYTVGFDIEDMKRAEDALKRSEAYLAEAQKLSRTGSFAWNVSTGAIIWSEETYRIFECDPAIVVSMDMVLDRVHPHDRQAVQQVIDRAATHKRAFDIEHRLQMPGGTVKHLHVVAHALVDEPQNLQFAGAIMDITAAKETERALRRSETRYQNLFQAMAVAFFEVDYSRSRPMLRALRDAGVRDFRQYFKENPGSVRQIMQATRVVDVNDRSVALFGRGSKAELLTSGATFWPEESLQDYVEALLTSLERNKAFSTETRIRKLDGTVFDAHFTAWYASEDKDKGLVGVIDITARKQASLALERSEQRYRHLFNHMPVALWQLNARGLVELFKQLRSEGVTDLGPHFDAHPGLLQRCMEMLTIEEVNEHTVQMLGGCDKSEIVGTSIARYFPENSATFRRSMVSRYRGDLNYAAETKLSTLDGRVIDVLYTASRVGPISEPGMSLLGVIDITERKQAEEALRRSEQRYRHLFHNMPLALWQLNGDRLGAMFRELRAQGVTDLSAYIDDNPGFVSTMIGAMVVEEVNDYAIKMFGARSRDELLGPTHWLWTRSIETARRAFEGRWSGEEFFQETTKLMTRDGRVIDALYTVARPQTSGGLPISLASMIDLSKQVQAQEELQRVRADFAHAARVSMLGELTASIAHEVNQPLAAIAAGGEASLRWLARPIPDVGEVHDLTTRMVADARRASEIIARVRGMATRRVPEQMLLSLDDVIREALLFLRHEVESRGVAVSHFPALGSQEVRADRTQLQQVVVNLAVNAMQAMAQSGSRDRNIIIRTALQDSTTVRCSVEDSGPGVESQQITQLFDSFFTTKDMGMGLGLRICRSIVEAHGGRIEVDNTSALGGARFSFTLPVASPTR
jgi:PAS domain S-box-containing protein